MKTGRRDIEQSLRAAGRMAGAVEVACYVAAALCALSVAVPLVLWVAARVPLGMDAPDYYASTYNTARHVFRYCVLCAAFLVCAIIARRVRKGQTPFSSHCAHMALVMACLLALVFAMDLLLPAVYDTVNHMTSMGALNFGTPTASPDDLEPTFSLGNLLATLVMFFLSAVLHYGSLLQELSDGTF